jgi:hypothetical protein
VLLADRSIDRFVVPTTSKCDNSEWIRSLLNGDPINVSQANRVFLLEFAISIGSTELENLLFAAEIESPEITLSGVVPRLIWKSARDCDASKEISFIRAHLKRIPVVELGTLSLGVLEAVLASGDLVLSDEDCLLGPIAQLGRECLSLIRFVECQFLSPNGVRE